MTSDYPSIVFSRSCSISLNSLDAPISFRILDGLLMEETRLLLTLSFENRYYYVSGEKSLSFKCMLKRLQFGFVKIASTKGRTLSLRFIPDRSRCWRQTLFCKKSDRKVINFSLSESFFFFFFFFPVERAESLFGYLYGGSD